MFEATKCKRETLNKKLHMFLAGVGGGVSRSEEVVFRACLSWKIGLLALGGHGCLSLCVSEKCPVK